jgi:TonB family protein
MIARLFPLALSNHQKYLYLNMHKILLIICCLFIGQVFKAQQRDPSIILYDKGNAAVSRKDYRTADSLFTLSLNLAPHPDSYYNRAVCRRQLNDFKGYCLDLNSASELGDDESLRLYSKQCIKSDTIYKKHNAELCSKNDFEYVEFVTSYKYNSDFDYNKHDTAGNCILSKLRTDNIVFYRNCKEVKEAMYKCSIDSLVNFIKTQTEFSKHVKQKDLVGVTYISVLVDEKGKVLKVENLSNYINEGDDELIKILLSMPDWQPAIYNNKIVKFKHEFSVKFYNDVVEFIRVESIVNNVNEIFTVVEEMPEFPGGAMEMMRFIQKNIVYPQMAKEAGLSGKCFLKFVVNTDGRISDIEILKGISKCVACDKEAVRVVSIMPKWKPGKQNGEVVSCFFDLPINFQLK